MPSLSRRVFKDNHNVTYFASASRNGENRIVTSGDRSGFSILSASANRLLKRNIRTTKYNYSRNSRKRPPNMSSQGGNKGGHLPELRP